MKFFTNKIMWITMLMFVVFLSGAAMAADQTQDAPPAGIKSESVVKVPDISTIIPLSAKLAGRLAILKIHVSGLPDTTLVEKQYAQILPKLEAISDQLKQMKESKEFQFNQIAKIRSTIKHVESSIIDINTPFTQSIRRLGVWRIKWLEEKKNWHQWQLSLNTKTAPVQLNSCFEKTNSTIDTALKLINEKLGEMMIVQEKAGVIEAKQMAYDSAIDEMAMGNRWGARLNASPPMFSSQYFSQFTVGLWFSMKTGLENGLLQGHGFFSSQGHGIFFQIIASFLFGIFFYRKKHLLINSDHWRFIAVRPFAAGIFLVSMTAMIIYAYYGMHILWRTANFFIAGISFILLSESLITIPWKRHSVFGIILILIAVQLMYVINLPLPLFRFCAVLISLAGIVFFLRWTKESIENKDPAIFSVILRLGAVYLFITLFAELFGVFAPPLYLVTSFINSIGLAVYLMMFLYIIHGGVDWLIVHSPLMKSDAFHKDEIVSINARTKRLINAAIWGMVYIPAVLSIWRVYENMSEAAKGILAFGFNIGKQRISLRLVIFTAGIFYVTFLISWFLQKILMNIVLVKKVVEQGVRFSITRLIHYIIVFIGFLIASSVLGLDITKLTFFISALGVGIGFGMQGIVNNLISGLILLFERPVRVGDSIEIDGKWSEIKRIGLRATTVQTVEQADVIIPNGDLLANHVTNWTLANRQVRLVIPVGVAYGSDIPLVMETLIACADDNPRLAQRTKPQVLFISFGDSTLNFELRVWVLDADYRMEVRSEVNQEIDRRFREANIVIAFPQRDIHVRSMDTSVLIPQTESGAE